MGGELACYRTAVVGAKKGAPLPSALLSLTTHPPIPRSPTQAALSPGRHALAPLPTAPAPAAARRRPAPRAATAMVNVDFSPALFLGMGLIGGGLTLYQLRRFRPGLSRDFDVIVSSVAIFSGGILVFQGWRLDPLLLFCQLLTAGMALAFAVETLRLREEVAEAEVREKERKVDGRGWGWGERGHLSSHTQHTLAPSLFTGARRGRPVPVCGRPPGGRRRRALLPGRRPAPARSTVCARRGRLLFPVGPGPARAGSVL